jgi:ubiquinone/menaquinone biosynthesis C-methylase UbiE/uncharacterized protein YbaR (Trm112 family)
MPSRDSILRKLDIKPTSWVLEIGGGPMPFYRSDILADKFLVDNTERCGNLLYDRPLVICDAHHLPFIDKSFDYIFCSQVLEHLVNPKLFFNEIQRVGKKGYIETPSEIREKLFGWPFHKWVVRKDGNELLLRENNLTQGFGIFFHRLQLTNYEFSMFVELNHDLLNVCYEWHNTIKYKFVSVDDTKKTVEKQYIRAEDISKYNLSKPTPVKIRNRIQFIKYIIKFVPKPLKMQLKRHLIRSKIGYRHAEKESFEYLLRILACPICKKKVEFNITGKNYVCSHCNKIYKSENNIPIMLID